MATLIDTIEVKRNSRMLFRFGSMWTTIPDTKEVVKRAWNETRRGNAISTTLYRIK
jgi:hypothetical protein